MTLRQFIRENRNEIDAIINRVVNYVPRTASCNCSRSGTDHYHDDAPRINDDERRSWVMNDEFLYRAARRAGVRI